MPNFKRHVTTGAVVGGVGNLVWQLLKIYNSSNPPKDLLEALGRIDLVEAAAFAGLGAACAALPDILEPATNPNHRALFHSVTCGSAVAYGAFGKHSEEWSEEQRHATQMAALSYLSHLWLDSGTTKSLPLLC